MIEMRKRLISSGQLIISNYHPDDKKKVIHLLDTLTGMRMYYQTDHYVPTSQWEHCLQKGSISQEGIILLVVKFKHQIVGYARLFPENDDKRVCRIGNIGLGLLEAYRKQGIGRQLLEKLIVLAPTLGYDILVADILDVNVASMTLFTCCGFVPVREKKIFLPFLACDVLEARVEKSLSALEGIHGGE